MNAFTFIFATWAVWQMVQALPFPVALKIAFTIVAIIIVLYVLFRQVT